MSSPHVVSRRSRVHRRLRRIALWSLGVVVVLALVAAGAGVWTVRRSFPTQDGSMTLTGLASPVTVHRDEYGIPQIYGKTADDVFRAQGFLHAQDRFWEMDFRRHVTAGRVAELFGESQVDTDKYLRTMGWWKVAEQEWSLLAADSKQFLNAYADGVNAWLAANTDAAGEGFEPNGSVSLEYAILGLQNSDYVIEKWQPVDSLAWLKAMAWDLRGNMEAEIRRAALLAHGLSKEQVEDLYPAYPYDKNLPIVLPEDLPGDDIPAPATTASIPLGEQAGMGSALTRLADDLAALPGLMGNADGDGIGSNSWVIGGQHTSTGKPILANDPHLSPSQPGIWYQMGLHCECGLDVAGFTFAGVPGVVIGHNAKIAWGFTNLDPDVIDLYLEWLDGDKVQVGEAWEPVSARQETIKVAGGEDVIITVRTTKHGPLLSDASESLSDLAKSTKTGGAPTYGLAMRWTALDPGRTGDALFALNVASNWDEFRAAAALFEVPAQNIVFADVEGNIGYQSPGRIPVRGSGDGKWFAPGWDPAYDWTGFIPFEQLPSVLNPERGYVVTANQAVIGEQYPHHLTDDWSYGYRSQRICDLIEDAKRSGKISAEDVRRMQFDNRNGFAPALIPALKAAARPALSRVEQEADALLTGWDFQQPADSAAAAYYNAIWRNLLILTFDELDGEQVEGKYTPDGGDRWFEVVGSLLSHPDDAWWDAKSTPEVERRDDILAQAMSAAVKELADAQGEQVSKWRWGAMHTLTPTHGTFGESGIGPIEWLFNRDQAETSGGDAIVNATGWSAGAGYEVDAVPSMRMIVDMSDLDASQWIQLTGNSGHAFHPNYADQFELWRTGQTLPFRFDRATIEREATATLMLNP